MPPAETAHRMTMPTRIHRLVALLALACAPSLAIADDAPAEAVDFARDIQPLLARHCQECHGAQRQEGGLRLTARAAALAGGDDTHPEILYFLAHNPDPKIRKTVAENVLTPVQASGKLATDRDVDVRLALSARLVALLPEWLGEAAPLHWMAVGRHRLTPAVRRLAENLRNRFAALDTAEAPR